MTLDDIEGMSDAEWMAMSPEAQAEASKVLLDALVADGVAYLGEDGRYRMREDVVYLGNGIAYAPKPN